MKIEEFQKKYYSMNKMTNENIKKEFNVSVSTFYRYLKELNIKKKGKKSNNTRKLKIEK